MLRFDSIPNTFHQGIVCTAGWTASGARRNSCQGTKGDAQKVNARILLLLGFKIHISYIDFFSSCTD